MSARSRLGTMAFVAAGAAAVMALPTSQKTVKAQSTVQPVSSGSVDVTAVAAQTVAYWTPERMASAVEAPLGKADGNHTINVIPDGAPAGAPGSAGGADVGSAQINGPSLVSGGGGTGLLSVPYHTPIPFTRWQYFAVYKRYPIYPVGKLFFTNLGINYVCSGSVIYTNTVWTAGHCVANTEGGNQFSTNVLFCPVYDTGANPGVGCWAAATLTTWPAWINNGSYEWDMGGINLSTCGTQNCTSIANVTGYLGFAWNQIEEQHWMHFGYPQGSPFNGNKIQVCASEFGYEDSEGNNQGGHNSLASGCDQTGGSSGGPWIISWGLPGQIGGGAGNYVNGHQDWLHTAFPNEINTPYFDTRACNIAFAAGRTDLSC